ncbi:unnamed protein product [Sphagnum jensenii]|uniref:Uncharacterized protein n=1 Tax=Sphagnum jensenii TaxID=128206 RepID=A0ABP1BZD8_9BRYO
MIGVVTDGERMNMGHIIGIQKQLVNLVTYDVTQIIAFLHEWREQRGVAVLFVVSDMWWVQVFAVAPGLELVHKMFYELQARLLLICQQCAYVNKLVINLQMVYELHCIDMDAEFGDLDALDNFQRFDWFVTFEALKLFV